MEYKVYVLRSLVDRTLYIGLTSDLARRLKEHNSGYVRWTKNHRPYVMVYSEETPDRPTARKREKWLKSGCGREFVKAFIGNHYSEVAQW
ncbi:MAG: GIY-YIG nuclease family protein [Patescibacteria group bacterium]